MDENAKSHAKITGHAPSSGLSRREWVQRMLAGAGAGIAAPALAEARGANAVLPANSQATTAANAAVGEWKPAFLDGPQNQTLIALAERIVPGSTGALVNRFLDAAFDASTRESQQMFVASLNALEGEALRQFTKSFQQLSADQQDQVLTAASTSQPASPDLPKGAGAAGIAPGVQPPPPTLREYFEYLKAWISSAYYSSEVGMKELGWTGENFFSSLPGCQHQGGHS